jgi:phosphoribosylaminoimidazolecarboxamide formyltransferase/IMP cyclohydrolase
MQPQEPPATTAAATRIRRALVSVSDKRHLEPFARALAEEGIEILATGGTRRVLEAAGIRTREVADITGFPEMMNGRVKTLHPRVHGGILALRGDPGHEASMQEHGILPIDLVVVNLYPFEATVEKPGVRREEAIEEIDIGGPSMVRSAAKNHEHVAVVVDPTDYGRVMDGLARHGGTLSRELRRELAAKAFAATAAYDAAISRWLHEADSPAEAAWPETWTFAGKKVLDLRYGENPHQRAAFYRSPRARPPSLPTAENLGGKQLSYNNLIDLDAALALALEFERPFACVVKHNNPCGAACGDDLARALADAWAGDPLSAFGSVLAANRTVDVACARFLVSENRFVEAIVAPSFDAEALDLLRTGAKWGKNVRLLACGQVVASERASDPRAVEVRPLSGGFLVQTPDRVPDEAARFRVVTRAAPSEADLASLAFAMRVCKHVRSNAIVLAQGERVVGVGAGQMSRVDSVRIAVHKAGERARGSVLASDAFFPFPDGVEAAMDAGVRAILEPGGSVRDDEVQAACEARGVPLVFSGVRHFRH